MAYRWLSRSTDLGLSLLIMKRDSGHHANPEANHLLLAGLSDILIKSATECPKYGFILPTGFSGEYNIEHQ